MEQFNINEAEETTKKAYTTKKEDLTEVNMWINENECEIVKMWSVSTWNNVVEKVRDKSGECLVDQHEPNV